MRCHRGPDHEANIRKAFKPGDAETEARIAAQHKADRAGWWAYHPNAEQWSDAPVVEEVSIDDLLDSETLAQEAGQASDPEFCTFILEIGELTTKLIMRLPARQAEALRLACDGCSQAEIAEAMGIAEKTVEMHLSLARTKLREWLGDERFDDLMKSLAS